MQEPATIEQLYTAVGRFAINWARLECALELLLMRARLMLKGPDYWLDHRLQQKIKASREVLTKLPSVVVANLEPIIDHIDHLSTTRHDLIHGVAFVDPSQDTISFSTMLQGRRKPRRPIHKTTVAAIAATADEVWELEGDLLDAASDL